MSPHLCGDIGHRDAGETLFSAVRAAHSMATDDDGSTAEILRALSSMSDSENRDTYLTMYIDLRDPHREKVLRRRQRAIRSAMADRSTASAVDSMFERAWELASSLPGKPRSAAIFVHAGGEVEEARGLGARIDNALILDASPYVLPLARFADEYEGFLLMLLDGQRASIHYVEDAKAETMSEKEHGAIGRHRKGGWSQMRYQRNREGIVKSFYDEVSSQLDGLLDELGDLRIIIAGPGSAKTQFQERMSKRALSLVAAVEDADLSEGQSALFDRFIERAKEVENQEEAEYIDRLRRGLMTGVMATIGTESVLEAAEGGRVDSLLVLEGHSVAGLKCEPCDAYMFTPGSPCPSCGGSGNEVDLANEAVEAAIRGSSHVEFIDDPFLSEVGGLAALLRW